MSEPLMTANPLAGFRAHEAEIRAAIDRVLIGGRYVLGPEVEAFEQEFAAYHGGGNVVGVANGTEALELALRAVGIGPGDNVATVANTVSATVSAIEQIGAQPVFVEIDPATMLMSPVALDGVLARNSGAVKAVIPVHLYGQPAALPEIVEIARRNGAKVIEDCAQSHGAVIADRHAGTWGDAAAYSFYPTKNLGALGDGGAVFTRDRATSERVRLLRQYGWRQRYVSEIAGRNSRLDEIQAAVLRVKLKYLDAENVTRDALAKRYDERLSGSSLRLPKTAQGTTPVWHQYAVRTPRRDSLQTFLAERGILCAPLYPVPLHRQPAYQQANVNLPETERACSEVLCLPLHPGITDADVDRVSTEILRWAAP